MKSVATSLYALAIAAGVAVVVSVIGHMTVQPGHDEWRRDLTSAQQATAEARAAAAAKAAADAAAAEEAEAAALAEQRRQQAQSALAMTMGGGGGGPAGAPGAGFNPLGPAGGQRAAYDGPRNAEYGNLPDTDGVETVYFNCTGCHSTGLFTQQRMTRDRWDYTLDWMVTSGGMAELPEEDRSVVLEYLVRHFGS